VPVFGKWKTVMRWHSGNYMVGLPIYEPGDTAIPAAEIPALPSFTRDLAPDRKILQRESKIHGSLVPMLAYLTMLSIAMLLLASLAWGIWRVSRPVPEDWADVGSPGASKPRAAKPAASVTPHAA
jgi:hypothetical protein